MPLRPGETPPPPPPPRSVRIQPLGEGFAHVACPRHEEDDVPPGAAYRIVVFTPGGGTANEVACEKCADNVRRAALASGALLIEAAS